MEQLVTLKTEPVLVEVALQEIFVKILAKTESLEITVNKVVNAKVKPQLDVIQLLELANVNLGLKEFNASQNAKLENSDQAVIKTVIAKTIVHAHLKLAAVSATVGGRVIIAINLAMRGIMV